MSERNVTDSPEKPEVRNTRLVKVGNLTIGADSPIVVQSMCATKTQDIEATSASMFRLQI